MAKLTHADLIDRRLAPFQVFTTLAMLASLVMFAWVKFGPARAAASLSQNIMQLAALRAIAGLADRQVRALRGRASQDASTQRKIEVAG